MLNAIKALWRWLTDENWQRRHFVLSPFGIAAATLLVTHLRDKELRPPIAHFDELAAFVSISAVLYGMAAVIVELIVGKAVFYTLSQIGKAMRAVKEQHRAEFIEQMRTDPEFRAEVLAEVKTNGHRRHRRHLRSDAPIDDEETR